MQCASCGRAYVPPANFCPSCGASTQPSSAASMAVAPNPWVAPTTSRGNPPPYGVATGPPPPMTPTYGAPAYGAPSYGILPADTRNRQRRRQKMIVGIAAAIAGFVVVGVALNATSTSGGKSSADAPPPAQTVADGNGVLVTYKAGHFSDRFPSTPVEAQQPGSIGGVHYTVYVAAVAAPQRLLVGSEDIDISLPDDQVGMTLQAAVGSFAGTSGMRLVDQQPTTFRGKEARQGSLTDAQGNPYTFLVFLQSDRRLYMIFGPTGDEFDGLAANFSALK